VNIMDFTFFAVLVTIAAIIYAFIARDLQYRFGNRKEMDAFQAKSKVLTEEMNEAGKRKDTKKIEELMGRQAELMKEMTGLMMGSFKVMILVLAVFFFFTWSINQLDPTAKDDIVLKLQDNGTGCDLAKGDGIFTVCYTPNNEKGSWGVYVKALKTDGGTLGENGSYFYYALNDSSPYVKGPKGEAVGIAIEPKLVPEGGQAKIAVTAAGANEVEVMLDNGTRFYMDLPFTIPIIEVKRINEAYWWFIFLALISGLVISFLLGQIKKMKEKKA